MDVTVVDVPERSRFEATTADGVVAGFAAYTISNRFMTFTHTEVDPAFEGQGVGSALAREALRDARRRQFQIIPVCPYIKDYLAKHPDVFDGIEPGDTAL